MGSYLWSSTTQTGLTPVNTKVEYFFNKTNEDITDSSPKEHIQINLSIKNCEIGSRYHIEFLYSDNNDFTSKGKSEILEAQSNQIDFHMSFITDYFFEKQQNVIFRINKDMSNAIRDYSVNTTIGNIMGSRGQILVKKYFNNEELIIKASNLKNNNMSLNMNFQFENLKILNGNIFFYLKRGTGGNNYVTLYKSEVQQLFKYIKFENIRIPSSVLGDFNSPLVIEIFLFNSQTDYKVLCGHVTTVNRLLSNNEKEVDIFNFSGQAIFKLYNNTLISKDYSFLDYIRGGLQIALTIGIDFTASNGKPNEYKSLHYTGDNNFNFYEKAIRSCGDVVAYYDYDQLFPVYGYGAILKGYSSQVNHCFNLNLNEDPNINGIDGVLECYRKNISYLTFYGPTHFAPLIERLVSTVKHENNQKVYTILMILTDGIINDMDATIDALVEASYLPISVIIIGIGYSDFSNMDVLDADDQPLYDRNGRRAARDLVQFVPFYKYENDGKKLAEQVLEEIPTQLVEYYRMMNIPPGDPIVDSI
jgi:hypothetical protein